MTTFLFYSNILIRAYVCMWMGGGGVCDRTEHLKKIVNNYVVLIICCCLTRRGGWTTVSFFSFDTISNQQIGRLQSIGIGSLCIALQINLNTHRFIYVFISIKLYFMWFFYFAHYFIKIGCNLVFFSCQRWIQWFHWICRHIQPNIQFSSDCCSSFSIKFV